MRRVTNLLRALSIAPFLISLPGKAQKVPLSTEKPATVEGMVSNSITGEPVPHAHVQLLPVTGTQKSIYGAITTPAGYFSMTMVPPGSYFLQAYRVGFLPSSALQSGQINLQPESNVKGLRITLVPSAVISGHVLDAESHPVANASVEVMGWNNHLGSQSNDRGEFRVGGLAPGNYLVRALVARTGPPEIRSDGTREVNYQATFYPASSLPSQAVRVQVRAGQEISDIDIKLKQAPIVRVSGQVTGVPPGANVISVQIANQQVQNAIVNADHQFTIWRLNPGQHWLIAQCYAAGKALVSAPTPIHVAGSNIDNVDLNVIAPFEVAGHINLDPLGADSEDKSGSRMALLVPVATMIPIQAAVGLNGDFAFKDVRAGRYLVRVSGFPDGVYVSDADAGPMKLQDGILDLSNGATASDLAITLGTDGGTISGKLLHEQNLPPVPFVLLLASTPWGHAVLNEAPVGPDGSYAFHNLAPGKYKLVAVDQFGGSIDPDVLLALKHGIVEEVDIDSGESVSRDLRLSVPDRQ